MKKILLDENMMSPRLMHCFPEGYQPMTARWMGWGGKGNGELLRLAAESLFDAVVTLDKKMEFEQNPETLPLPVIILDPHEQTIPVIEELITNCVIPLLEQGVETRFYRFGKGLD